jgi:hypothetical protein
MPFRMPFITPGVSKTTIINGLVLKKILQQDPAINQNIGGAVSKDVTAFHTGQTPVTSAGVAEGTITDSPDNRVKLFDNLTKNTIEYDPGTGAREVFGRLTEAAGTWTLSFYYMSDLGVETAYALPGGAARYDYYYVIRTNLKDVDEGFAISDVRELPIDMDKFAPEIIVDTTGKGTHTTFASAVAAMTDGDTMWVREGNYSAEGAQVFTNIDDFTIIYSDGALLPAVTYTNCTYGKIFGGHWTLGNAVSLTSCTRLTVYGGYYEETFTINGSSYVEVTGNAIFTRTWPSAAVAMSGSCTVLSFIGIHCGNDFRFDGATISGMVVANSIIGAANGITSILTNVTFSDCYLSGRDPAGDHWGFFSGTWIRVSFDNCRFGLQTTGPGGGIYSSLWFANGTFTALQVMNCSGPTYGGAGDACFIVFGNTGQTINLTDLIVSNNQSGNHISYAGTVNCTRGIVSNNSVRDLNLGWNTITDLVVAGNQYFGTFTMPALSAAPVRDFKEYGNARKVMQLTAIDPPTLVAGDSWFNTTALAPIPNPIDVTKFIKYYDGTNTVILSPFGLVPKLAADPGVGSLVAGTVWFNTTDFQYKGYDGTAVVILG